jgi:hypothetical protein
MKIGLYNLEPNIVNTAMMQVSAYHKSQGDDVEIYNALFHNDYDKIYAFSLFDFTDKGYVTEDMICGGTGFDIKSRLPKEIEVCDYDWSLYPDCDHSILWFSRGCNYNHPYCVVPEKEGRIVSVEPKNLNPNGKYIKVQDNNFFQNPEWRNAINRLLEYDQPVVFEGIDIRKLDEEMCNALLSVKRKGYIHFAWDNPREDMIPHIKRVLQWIKPHKFMCYVLIGYWSTPEEDLMRIEALRRFKIDPFVMPMNKEDPYQKAFTRWCNCFQLRNVSWEEYKYKK